MGESQGTIVHPDPNADIFDAPNSGLMDIAPDTLSTAVQPSMGQAQEGHCCSRQRRSTDDTSMGVVLSLMLMQQY